LTQNIINAGGASDGFSQTGGNDGTLVVNVGPTGSKVAAMSFAADGTPTLVKGPTIGSAPTPIPAGTAPLYGCRAWCRFDGTATGTNAPAAGGNVTSITRLSAGKYTINFTTAMPDANYATTVTPGDAGGTAVRMGLITTPAPTTTAVNIETVNSGFAATDEALISVVIFR
jgi:hypothetical protein